MNSKQYKEIIRPFLCLINVFVHSVAYVPEECIAFGKQIWRR